MIILNVRYELIKRVDELTHQLRICDINGILESITVHGFTEKEVVEQFCKQKRCRMVKGIITVNTETGSLHIENKEDSNIYVIFNEYYHILLKEKCESSISLKNPLRVVEAVGNVNFYRDTLKYFALPKSSSFWIVEKSGELGKNVISYLWEGERFSIKENIDYSEIKTSSETIRNIITVAPEKNLFITDSTCTIDMFMKAYPDMYFRLLYEDFMEGIERKYKDYRRTVIVEIDKEDNIKRQILIKTKKRIPLYICIPVYAYKDFYAVFEAIKIKE